MEGNSHRHLIPLSSISAELPYGLRFDYKDSYLESSLEARGMLFPILLFHDGKKQVVVSGCKRFSYALRKDWKEIPATVIGEKFSRKELFFLSLFSNWNQKFTELDRMEILRKGEMDFALSRDELSGTVLPAIGIAVSAFEEYRQAAKLPAEILVLIHAGKLPFRGSSSLVRFSREEQLYLAGNVLNRMHLTTNQLTLVSEWISDLKRSRKRPLETLFVEKNLSAVLKQNKDDERKKGEKLFETVRSLRFPKISEAEKKFLHLKEKLRDMPEIQLNRPEGLETEGVTLHARLRDHQGVEKVLSFLENHRRTLEAFL